MKATLVPGLTQTATLPATEDLTVLHVTPHLPSLTDLPRVFATASMAAFTEATCVDLPRTHLDPDEAGAIRSDTHRRSVITTSRFSTRVTERAREAGATS